MLELWIGNKNYSSWSLRPWLLLRHAGIAFEERRLRLFTADFTAQLAKVSPAGRVPVLVDDGLAVWDSLAIAEYAAERFPQHRLWPADAHDRATARSVCAEMHAGFSALRTKFPMNVEAHLPLHLPHLHHLFHDPALQHDVGRIVAMWTELRDRHGARGPFLFGEFSVADAFYAPVALRFRTYEPPLLPQPVTDYLGTMLALPAMREWMDAARAEREFLAQNEPYRTSPDEHLFVQG